MKRNKNTFITLSLILLFTLSFTACNFKIDKEQIKENVSNFFDEISNTQGYINTHLVAKEEFLKISEYLNTSNPALIEKFISEDVSEEKIAEMLELWEGTLISYDEYISTNYGGYKAKGEYTKLIIRPKVRNIETTETINNDYHYVFDFCYIVVHEDKAKEGLWFIELKKFKGEEQVSSVYTGEPV
ncbi:MAG: hypothetical protein LBM93_15405 [Oscillospiraceae bacterium]|nr:hypothetical protein [Oscillospiraceae bacterium]